MKIFAVCLIMGLSLTARAQFTIPPTNQEHLDRIQNLLTDTNKYVTDYVFDSVFNGLMGKIGGVFYKDGKVVSTSGVVDDKSITINHAFANWFRGKFKLQATVAGAAQNSFVDVFSGGKYNKVFTGGLTFNWFTGTRMGGYKQFDKNRLTLLLQAADLDFESGGKDAAVRHYKMLLDSISRIYNECLVGLKKDDRAKKQYHFLVANQADKNVPCGLKRIRVLLDSLGILTKYYKKEVDLDDWDTAMGGLIQAVMLNRDAVAADLAIGDQIAIQDSLQYAAKWTSLSMFWLSGGLKYNNSAYPLQNDPDTTNLFTRSYYDNYFSFNASANWLHVYKRMTLFISPTFKLQNSRLFDSTTMVTVQSVRPYLLPADSLQSIRITSFYPKLADRVNVASFEVPLTLFWPNSGLGLDFDQGIAFSSSIRNVYTRVGVYLPVAVDAKTTITVEPLIRLTNLQQRSLGFWKDQFSFGFSLSVAIPTYISGS